MGNEPRTSDREPRVVRNAENRQQLRDARKRERQILDQQQSDLRAVMQLEAGRRVISRILGQGHLLEHFWSPNSEVHYKLGERGLALWLYDEIMFADPELMFTLMREHQMARVQEAREQAAAAQARDDEEFADG